MFTTGLQSRPRQSKPGLHQSFRVVILVLCLISLVHNTKTIKQVSPNRDFPDSPKGLKTNQSVTSKDADGCHHIFLDGGANIGVHGRFLLEPNMYPDAKDANKIFSDAFGPQESRDNRDFCVFEMEANPAHYQKLKEKENAYAKLGWRYKAMNVGLSDRYGTIPFYRRNDEHNEEWGFSMKKFFDGAEQVDVPTIRFSSWLEEHVLSRAMPSKVYGKYKTDHPVIVAKLDIEGSEYVVLPDLISSGVFCQLDLVFGEFHSRAAPFNDYFPGLDVMLQTPEQTKEFEQALAKVIKGFSRTCKARFSHLDDESYLHDGVPLPTGNQTNLISDGHDKQ